jgi:hypothetical protein
VVLSLPKELVSLLWAEVTVAFDALIVEDATRAANTAEGNREPENDNCDDGKSCSRSLGLSICLCDCVCKRIILLLIFLVFVALAFATLLLTKAKLSTTVAKSIGKCFLCIF